MKLIRLFFQLFLLLIVSREDDLHSLPVRHVDAQEFDPRVRQILDEVRRQVSESHFGSKSSDLFYNEVKRLLKSKHGIDWFTPLELNKGMHVDFPPSLK